MEKKEIRTKRKKLSVRSKFPKIGGRLSLTRSNKYLFAQLIDQLTGKTVLGKSDKQLLLKEKTTKTDRAKEFGKSFGAEVLKIKMEKIVFDRGSSRYHGRVKSFAEGAREAGLKF